MQQRLWLLLALLLLLATACGGGAGEGEGQEIPTIAPTLAGATDMEESPRITQTPSANVPPTWTPSSPLVAPTRLTPPADTSGGEESSSVEPDENDDVYVVQAGDTLAEIAIAFDVDLDVLATVNGIENVDLIEVGQQLVVPRD